MSVLIGEGKMKGIFGILVKALNLLITTIAGLGCFTSDSKVKIASPTRGALGRKKQNKYVAAFERIN